MFREKPLCDPPETDSEGHVPDWGPGKGVVPRRRGVGPFYRVTGGGLPDPLVPQPVLSLEPSFPDEAGAVPLYTRRAQ